MLNSATTRPPAPDLRVLYLSDLAQTRGHIYRVLHNVVALREAGIHADWAPPADVAPEVIDQAHIVIVFRGLWSDRLQGIFERCRAKATPIGYDIDDLIFDPDVLTEENFDFLRRANDAARKDWMENRVFKHQRSVQEADFAIAPTAPLATALQRFGPSAFVVPNGFDQAMLEAANAAHRAEKPSKSDGWLRVGYASGTPTHQKDFATIAPLLADLLDQRPNVILSVVGFLDLDEFPELIPHQARIERRELVPHEDLLQEYARFDINLAPLEIGNPFCEAKSALKFVEAGLVQTPTIAAATQPYREAISDGKTGYLAHNADTWRNGIAALVDDPTHRDRIGLNAHQDILRTLGAEERAAGLQRVFQSLKAR